MKCPNCGATTDEIICEYCGTIINTAEISNQPDASNNTESYNMAEESDNYASYNSKEISNKSKNGNAIKNSIAEKLEDFKRLDKKKRSMIKLFGILFILIVLLIIANISSKDEVATLDIKEYTMITKQFEGIIFDVPKEWKEKKEKNSENFVGYSFNANEKDSLSVFFINLGDIVVEEDKSQAIDILMESAVEGVENYLEKERKSLVNNNEISFTYIECEGLWPDDDFEYNAKYLFFFYKNYLITFLFAVEKGEDGYEDYSEIYSTIINSINIDEVYFESKEQEPSESEALANSADEKAKIFYNAAIGKTASAIRDELEKLGYKASFSHAVSKQDFSESIISPDDKENSAFYIPWIITEVDKYDATKKTASFYINTQENISETQSKNAKEDALQAKLDVSYTWEAIERYGEKEYPYGFKLRSVMGVISQTMADENTWFLKAECEVKNEYGVWMKNLVCEAKVTGTTESPKVVYFAVY